MRFLAILLGLLLASPAYAVLGGSASGTGGAGGGGGGGSTTAITINEVVPNLSTVPVIQRTAGSNNGLVSFSGTYTGSAPASVYIQAVDFNTHATIVQTYTNCSTSFGASGGNWSCKLNIPTYSNWQAAIAGVGPSPSVISGYTGTQWGVGSVIVMAGDSLAGFYPTKRNTNSSPSLKAYQWCTNPASLGAGAVACQNLGVNGWGTVNVVNIGYGYLSLLNTVQPAFNWPVAIFNSAFNSSWLVTGAGGTSSNTWTSTSCGGGASAGPWCNLTANLTLAGITDFESVIWYQGGQDSRSGTPPSSASVISALQALYLQFLGVTASRTKAQMVMFVDQLGPEQATSGHDTGFNNFRAGVQTAAASNGSTYNIVFSSSCIDCQTDTDQIHPNYAAYQHTGYRDGQTFLNFYGLSGGTYSGKGPEPSTCTRASANLTQVLTANGAAALKNSSGSTTLGTLTGWAVTDGGGATISSYAGSGTNVVITMNQNAAVGDGVTYLQGENPTITNIVYSDVLPGADTLGMPLLPTVGTVTCN